MSVVFGVNVISLEFIVRSGPKLIVAFIVVVTELFTILYALIVRLYIPTMGSFDYALK